MTAPGVEMCGHCRLSFGPYAACHHCGRCRCGALTDIHGGQPVEHGCTAAADAG